MDKRYKVQENKNLTGLSDEQIIDLLVEGYDRGSSNYNVDLDSCLTLSEICIVASLVTRKVYDKGYLCYAMKSKKNQLKPCTVMFGVYLFEDIDVYRWLEHEKAKRGENISGDLEDLFDKYVSIAKEQVRCNGAIIKSRIKVVK